MMQASNIVNSQVTAIGSNQNSKNSKDEGDEDSDCDEEEMRDNFDADDPPIITLQYEIRIQCAKEILVKDGTQLMIQCIRGNQKAQTNTVMLKSNTVYYNQKVLMKITLEKMPTKNKYGKKELVMKLVRVEDKTVLGQAVVDLANYSKCLERKLLSVDLQKSQFPEAVIDFYLTAAPMVGAERRQTQISRTGAINIATATQNLQSTRNANSVNFNDIRFEHAKK